jgi:pyrroline-5-carboxylate reductase
MRHKGITIGVAGLGNMGGAIISGLSREYGKECLFGYDVDPAKPQSLAHHLTPAESPLDLAKKCSILIIAVKPDIVPHLLAEIAPEVGDSVVISIAAGITIDTIASVIGADKKIIRAMPNTPAMVGQGMTVLSPNDSVDGAEIAHAEEIFSLLGKTLILPEKLLNAVTALSGSGPAYGFTLIQAMTDAGVKLGIPRDKALLLAAQTIKGAAEMVIETEEDPISLRGKVTSPGGTTIAAVHVLERAGFSGIMIDAIDEAMRVSIRLGEKK